MNPAWSRRAAEPESSRLTFEDLELDEDSREVARAGAPIDLTATEYRLLRYLMLNPRRVLTRRQLLEHVWDYDFGGDARVLVRAVGWCAGAVVFAQTIAVKIARISVQKSSEPACPPQNEAMR